MAKYYSSTFGKISGRHGNAVGVLRKDGSTYLRLYAKSSNPRTDKQQAHRAKFALSSKALVPFNPIFKDTIGITNGISTARSYAFKNAIVGEYPNLSIDYEKLMFSFGSLEKLHDVSVAINEGVMTVSWSFKKMYNCNANDCVSLVGFNKYTNQSIHIKNVALRADKTAKIDIHNSCVDSELHLWAYVTGGDQYSDSVFVDNGVHGTDNEVEQAVSEELGHEKEPVQVAANKAIASIVMIICNLLSLFKQVAIGDKIQFHINALSNKFFSVIRCVENSHIEKVINLNLEGSRRAAPERLCSKYKSLFNLMRVPIMGNLTENMVLIGKGRLCQGVRGAVSIINPASKIPLKLDYYYLKNTTLLLLAIYLFRLKHMHMLQEKLLC